MLWVGGNILLHGLEELHVVPDIPRMVRDLAHHAAEVSGIFSGIVHGLVNALGGAVFGLLVGGMLVTIVRRLTKRPEEVIVD
jgi:predicted DNA repair protein MutK